MGQTSGSGSSTGLGRPLSVPHAPLLVSAVDAHVGSPCRVILGGLGVTNVPGSTMFAKKLYLEQHRDWLRRLMIREPRGMPAQCLNLVLPPTDPAADVGLIIMEQASYYPPMSGGNLICVVTVLLETGTLPITGETTVVTVETPAGLVTARASCRAGRVLGVEVQNVPSFAAALDVAIDVEGLGTLRVDVAYGGMFYVLLDAKTLNLDLEPSCGAALAEIGERVKLAAREQIRVEHPENRAINKIESLMWHGGPKDPRNSGRNAVVVSTGAIDPLDRRTWKSVLDRCPCGTGTSARMAVLRAKGELGLNEDFRHESILDLVWTGRALADCVVGDHPAIRPSITGQAWISGYATYVLAADDPFPEGFTVTDLWAPEEPDAAPGPGPGSLPPPSRP